MKSLIKKYVVPHEGNDHRPHLLRDKGVLILILVILFIFGLAHIQAYLIRTRAPAAVVSSILIDLANQDRSNRGLAPLRINPNLTKAADLKAKDMAAKGYFGHVSPENIAPWHWFSLADYPFVYAGENLAVNFSESSDVEDAWMQSSSHRSNILNKAFTEIGIATAQGVFDGRPTTFVVQMFGAPAKSKAASTTSTVAKRASPSKQSVPTVKGAYVAREPVQAAERYSRLIDRIALEPKRILASIYGVVAFCIIVVVGHILAGEIKRHHIKMVFYGLGLVVLMLVLAYSYSSYLVTTIHII